MTTSQTTDFRNTVKSAFVSEKLISDNIFNVQKIFHELRTNNSCKEKNLSIKTDMNKAYARVEWTFIEVMLLKIRFCAQMGSLDYDKHFFDTI